MVRFRARHAVLGCIEEEGAMIRMLAVLAVALAAGCSTMRGNQGIVTETFMIPSQDPGITVHVRNKVLAGSSGHTAERIVLFVHGATFPSETMFDIDLPGGPWMEYAARRGFDAYIVDVRGYGRSTRPAAMRDRKSTRLNSSHT